MHRMNDFMLDYKVVVVMILLSMTSMDLMSKEVSLNSFLTNTSKEDLSTLVERDTSINDLFPNLTFTTSNMLVGDSTYVILNVNEILGYDTNGSEIEVFMPTPNGFEVEFDQTQTEVSNTTESEHRVEFAIKWNLSDGLQDALTVYLKSNLTIDFPFNQVSTSQVTIRVPSGMFPDLDGSGLNNTQNSRSSMIHYNNGHWTNNGRFNIGDDAINNDMNYFPGDTLGVHPDGNSYDYITFGLTNLGTRNIEFIDGQELPLFSFQFLRGNSCTEGIPVKILDHVEDSIFIENGKVNPQNNISVLSSRGDVYHGNYWNQGARCYDYDNDDVFNHQDECSQTSESHIHLVDDSGCYSGENSEDHYEELSLLDVHVVDNNNWTSTDTGTGLLLKSDSMIRANSRSRVALLFRAKEEGAQANVTFNVTPNSGGESNPINNVAIISLSIQNVSELEDSIIEN